MIRRVSLAAAVLAITLAASSSTAHAEEEWYGLHVAATDAGGWGLIVGGLMFDADPIIFLGVGALFLGGPIVHAAHGNYGRAGISFAARGGGALLGGVIGYALGKREGNSELAAVVGIFAGAFVGYLGGAITDIAVVAREDDDPAAAPRMLSFGGRF